MGEESWKDLCLEVMDLKRELRELRLPTSEFEKRMDAWEIKVAKEFARDKK